MKMGHDLLAFDGPSIQTNSLGEISSFSLLRILGIVIFGSENVKFDFLQRPQRFRWFVVNAVKEIDVGNNPTGDLGTLTEERANNHKRGQTYETQNIISTDKGSY